MAKLDEQQPTRKTTKVTTDSPKSQLRGRDLVYIDVDDDVTSIVGKIKASDEGVVALVPPKRVGVLQSVVNLKLLQRAAKTSKKRLAIVTTDPALVNLASGLAIPVAKNINAQATVPDMVDDEDISDVIDGDDTISLGLSNRPTAEDKDISAAVAAIETDDRIKNDLDADGVPDDEQTKINPRKPKKKAPNVNDLRKKVLLIGGAAVVLIAFLVWAIVFAPSATITIKAKTSSVDVSKTLSLIPSGDKDVAEGNIPPVVKQKKQNESVQFEATGTKEVGEKAKGTVAVCNKKPIMVSLTSKQENVVSLAAGTLLYYNGMQFALDGQVTVPGYSDDEGAEEQRVCRNVKVTAVSVGSEYNIADGSLLQVSGYNQSALAASAEGDFSGGSKKTIKVVQQSDVDAAVAKLKEKGDSDAAKKELSEQMSDSTVAISNGFSVSQSDVKVSPAVGEEATGTASASVEITYTLVGINRDDLREVLDAQLKDQVDTSKQKIYDNGLKDVKFSGFESTKDGYTVKIKTNGHVGPVIDEADVKKEAAGKKSEEIKALLKQTNGVSDVEVVMSPFWVHSAPAENKIKVNFTIDE